MVALLPSPCLSYYFLLQTPIIIKLCFESTWVVRSSCGSCRSSQQKETWEPIKKHDWTWKSCIISTLFTSPKQICFNHFNYHTSVAIALCLQSQSRDKSRIQTNLSKFPAYYVYQHWKMCSQWSTDLSAGSDHIICLLHSWAAGTHSHSVPSNALYMSQLILVFQYLKVSVCPNRKLLTVRTLFKSSGPDECCEEHFKCQHTMLLTY